MGSDWGALVERAQHEEQAQEAAGAARAHTAGPARRRVALAGMLSLSLVLAGGLFEWQALWTPAGPSPADLDHGRRALLALIDSSLADHLRVQGEYPEKLNEVLPLQVDVTYRRTEGGYELSVRLNDGTILNRKKP
jgi:hypothetical protein